MMQRHVRETVTTESFLNRNVPRDGSEKDKPAVTTHSVINRNGLEVLQRHVRETMTAHPFLNRNLAAEIAKKPESGFPEHPVLNRNTLSSVAETQESHCDRPPSPQQKQVERCCRDT